MKQCPQCLQNFTDDTLFCLSDGTPLNFVNDAPEEMTIIRPPVQNNQPPVSPVQKGVSPVFAYLTVGLLLLLLIGGAVALGLFALSRMSSGTNTNSEIAKESNKTPANFLPTAKDDQQNKIEQQKANLQEQQDQIEKEKQKLANERKKFNEEKNSEPPPSAPPPPPANRPPQPTARIKFGRGRVAESVSGIVYTQRSFVLEARSGQYLSASVNSNGGCVVFQNGGTSMGYSTSSGDNRITLVNNCSNEASFSLTVSIR